MKRSLQSQVHTGLLAERHGSSELRWESQNHAKWETFRGRCLSSGRQAFGCLPRLRSGEPQYLLPVDAGVFLPCGRCVECDKILGFWRIIAIFSPHCQAHMQNFQ